MIDFRYHLVSLVAVFMALAVGIVLGAGPLGQEISSTLEAQVRELREERNGLRAQLDQAEARDALKSDVIEIVIPTVTDNQLSGRRVAVLTLPGADRNIVGQLQDQVAMAGGQVVLTAALSDSWADPDQAATRHEVAAELAPGLADPEPRQGGEPTVETVVAAALSGRDEVPDSGAWRTATERLDELGFLDTNWADNQGAAALPPDSFLIVTGNLSAQQVEEDVSGETRLQQSLDLLAAFGALGTPTLVAGYGTESYADPVQAAQSPIVRGVRAESDIAESIGSVDNVERAAGQLAAVLGLRWSIEGQPGHWGLGTDALAPVPSVPVPLADEQEPLVPAPTLPVDSTEEQNEDQTEDQAEDQAGEPTGDESSVGSDPADTLPTGPLSPTAPAQGGDGTSAALPTTGAGDADSSAPGAGEQGTGGQGTGGPGTGGTGDSSPAEDTAPTSGSPSP